MASPETGSDRERLRAVASTIADAFAGVTGGDGLTRELLARAFEIGAAWGVADYVKHENGPVELCRSLAMIHLREDDANDGPLAIIQIHSAVWRRLVRLTESARVLFGDDASAERPSPARPS